MAEMIRLGAYRQGADPAVDAAIAVNPTLEAFLSQRPNERMGLDDSYLALAESMGVQVIEEGDVPPGADQAAPPGADANEAAAAA